MLKYNYGQRIGARAALAHPWFKNAPTVAIDKKLMKETLNNLRTF